MRQVYLALIIGLAGCGPNRPPQGELSPTAVAALRDSVRIFLDGFAAEMSHPPIGRKARESLAAFYAPDLVMSTDLAPDPLLVSTLDSLIPPDEIVTQPSWIRSTRFVWGPMVITPLAPGVAAFTAKYAEQVTDTTGTLTELPGVQQGVVRNGPSGWRFHSLQSSHPMTTHQRQAELARRMESGGGGQGPPR